jgi:hypothetical protein
MKILDRLPISVERAWLRFGGRYVRVRSNQLLVWVSVHLSGVLEPEESIPKFPAQEAMVSAGQSFRPRSSCIWRLEDRLEPFGEDQRELGEPALVDQAHADEISHMRSILVAIRQQLHGDQIL